jgi:hypothetical protein
MTMNLVRPTTEDGASNTINRGTFIPPAIARIEDTGLPQLWLQDLALKILYFQGYMTGFKVAEAISLPFGHR